MRPSKRKLDTATPWIAGAEDPLLNSQASLDASVSTPYADMMEYSTGSPDTLQHLDATENIESPNFTVTQQLDLSGGYHEMSDDSAESSKRSGKRASESISNQPSPQDSSMAGNISSNADFDMDDMIDFSNCIDSDPVTNSAIQDTLGINRMGMFGMTSSGFGQQPGPPENVRPHDLQRDSMTNFGMSSTPLFRDATSFTQLMTDANGADWQTGAVPVERHGRHHSIQSADSVSTSAWHYAPEKMSPMAMSQTQSPVAMPEPQLLQSQAVDHLPQQAPLSQPQPQAPSPEAMSKMAHGRMANRARQTSTQPPGSYHLYLPDDPRKSRVETQTPLNLILKPPPPGITKIHLPGEMVSKPKLMDKPKAQLNANTLEMTVSVVCTSAMQSEELRKKAFERAVQKKPHELPPDNTEDNVPQKGAEVRVCSGCMVREQKRAARKRVKNQDDEDLWLANENFRIIVFNCPETKLWEKTNALEGPPGLKLALPVRIACYCRHHGEKSGFNIIFTLKDYQGNVVAQNMTNPIMVTDDHKTTVGSLPLMPSLPASNGPPTLLPASPKPQTTAGATAKPSFTSPNALTPTARGNAGRRAPRAIMPGSGATSRAASPSQGGPSAKKRKSSRGAPPRIPPQTLSMTRADGSSQAVTGNGFTQSRATSVDANGSPIDASEQPYGSAMSSRQQSNAAPYSYVPSAGQSPASQFYSNPPSGNPSRAPSPQPSQQSLVSASSPTSPSRPPGDDLGQQGGNGNFQQGGSMFPNVSQPRRGHNGMMPNVMDGLVQTRLNDSPHPSLDAAFAVNDRRPRLSKVVPQEGSISGGYEVTVLGKALASGMDVWFGEQKAHYTTFWSPDCVICLVPAANVAGVVNVTVESPSAWHPELATTFRYIDDTNHRIMQNAIRVIGSRMNGQDMDINNVALQVLNTFGGHAQNGSSNTFTQAAPEPTGEQLESQLLSCLDFIDNEDSPYEADLDTKDSSGHTMLHLAAVKGFRRLAAALLVRGADPNVLDNSHCTPLHLAAMHNRPEVVQRLMRAGANSRLLNLSDLTAADLSESGAVTRAIRHSLARSQSTDFSHSRVSSVSSLRSLRSLCEPMSRINTNQEIDDGEESPEYTTGDFEDEDPDENVYMHMRRPSAPRHTPAKQAYREQLEQHADDDDAQPIKTMADLKEHFQAQLNQLQQSWALHARNHFPQMPQMPQIPALSAGLHDYQAYFQQAPFMRRMTSYMPGMNGSRPESQDSHSPKMDHRWWDLSSLMNQAPAPPPAYEEIFPQGDMDKKQASAAAAAADAEADEKCTNLYDQQQEVEAEEDAEEEVVQPGSHSEVEGENSDREPRIITIGRKNAITKEQQEQLLRARDRKHTRLRNDRNLFIIWIPLLIIMIFAMGYRCFPELPAILVNIVVAAVTIMKGFAVTAGSLGRRTLGTHDGNYRDRAVEL